MSGGTAILLLSSSRLELLAPEMSKNEIVDVERHSLFSSPFLCLDLVSKKDDREKERDGSSWAGG